MKDNLVISYYTYKKSSIQKFDYQFEISIEKIYQNIFFWYVIKILKEKR